MTDIPGAHLPKENGHITPPPSGNFPHPSAGNVPEETPVSSTSELTQTWVNVAKTFVIIFPIYALGYFEFSFSWLLIGLVIFFWWRRNTEGKLSRLNRAFAFFEQDERSIKQSVTISDLPPWVRHTVTYTRDECICPRCLSHLSWFSVKHVVFLRGIFLSFQEEGIS